MNINKIKMTDKEIQEYYEYKEATKGMIDKLTQQDLFFALEGRATSEIRNICQDRIDLDKEQVIHDLIDKFDKVTKSRLIKRQLLEQLLLLLETFDHDTDSYRKIFMKDESRP